MDNYNAMDQFNQNLLQKLNTQGGGLSKQQSVRKSLKGILNNKKIKSSDEKPNYVTKRLYLEPEKLKEKGAAIYILDQSVL